MISRSILFFATLSIFCLAGFTSAGAQVNDTIDFEQQFDEALELYDEANYIEAAHRFSQLHEVEARLFTGKSYFAAGYYTLAARYLQSISSRAPDEIYLDARYTLALNHFKSENYGRALDILYGLRDEADIQAEAGELYASIQHYLNKNQRKRAFHQSGIDSVRYDLIDYAADFNKPDHARHLLHAIASTFSAQVDSARISGIRTKIDTLEAQRGDTVSTAPAPPGTVYDVGIPLPAFDPDDNEFPVAQGLYYGILKAAENFNERNEDRRIALHHKDPQEQPKAVLDELAWTHHADLIIGPLFSQSAEAMAGDVEEYAIPMVPPLANSDSLNLDNPYIYQPNPTFAKRGRALARFAVNELDMDTLAVITERDTQGMEEAYAFRDEAERLGAKVIHFFQDYFADMGYNVSDYTPHFAGDTDYLSEEEKEDVQVRGIDGLFLAFTGGGARTLIDLVITDIEATRGDMALLGGEEMANINFSQRRLRNFDIFYMDSMYLNEEREWVQRFQEEFEEATGRSPNQFAYLGFDVADFLFRTLEEHPNPADLKRVIRDRPRYEGLIMKLAFAGSHVNSGMNFFEITEDGSVYLGDQDLEEVVDDLYNDDEEGDE